jgi:hypothetical protein
MMDTHHVPTPKLIVHQKLEKQLHEVHTTPHLTFPPLRKNQTKPLFFSMVIAIYGYHRGGKVSGEKAKSGVLAKAAMKRPVRNCKKLRPQPFDISYFAFPLRKARFQQNCEDIKSSYNL